MSTVSIRTWMWVLALGLIAGAFGPPPALAQTAPPPAGATQLQPEPPSGPQENVLIRTPDSAPLPPPPPPALLERAFPPLREGLASLPPFIRDTDLNVRLRTFYFNRQNENDVDNEAWAMGGWVQYASGWLFDTLAMGATYYTSFPLYTPDSRFGTSILASPDHDTIGVFGEAWGALRYKEYALLKGYRQKVDDGYVNSQDNRMVPNTFEGVTLSGKVGWAKYDLGYIWEIKPRDSNDFISMSRQAGDRQGGKGLYLSSVTLTPIPGLSLYAGNFYAEEVYNTAFGKGEYTHTLSPDLKVQVGVQYTNQRSVGDERVGDFSTWNFGLGARVIYRGLTFGAAGHMTDDEASIASPWGTWPGYLSLQVTDFNRAKEKAFGAGLKYDFGGSLLPFQVPGLSVHLLYAQGNDRIDPVSRLNQPTTREGDLDIVYNVQALKGLSFRFRNGYVSRGQDGIQKDFRIIINYELDLL